LSLRDRALSVLYLSAAFKEVLFFLSSPSSLFSAIAGGRDISSFA